MGWTLKKATAILLLLAAGLASAAVYQMPTPRFPSGNVSVTNLITIGGVYNESAVNATIVLWNFSASSPYDDSFLRANASNQDARIIALEGLPLGANFSALWGNASNQDARIIALESLPLGGNFSSLWSNASNQDARIISLEDGLTFARAAWIGDGAITSNQSVFSGNVNASGNITVRNGDPDDNLLLSVGGNIPIIRVIGGNRLEMTTDDASASYLWIRHLQDSDGDTGLFFSVNNNITQRMGFITYVAASGIRGLGFNSNTAEDKIFYPDANKAYNLGTNTLSWDNCYCDDLVNTPRDLVTLSENNAGDFTTETDSSAGAVFTGQKPETTRKAVTYADYLSVLKDVPYDEATGKTNQTEIPPMLRDKQGNDDTLSTYAMLMAERAAILELEARIGVICKNAPEACKT